MRAIVALFYLMFCVIVVGMMIPDSRERVIGKPAKPVLTTEQALVQEATEAAEAAEAGMTVTEHRQYHHNEAHISRQNQHIAASIVGAGGLIGLGFLLGFLFAHRREDEIRQQLRYEARHPDDPDPQRRPQ